MKQSGIIFKSCKAKVALAAGIFHREEVPIEAVKEQRDKAALSSLTARTDKRTRET
jgi:imidazole glycerol phosphate synthase subunit HisF